MVAWYFFFLFCTTVQVIFVTCYFPFGYHRIDSARFWNEDQRHKECEVLNDRPIIGILTQPPGETYSEVIFGSYVKYLESAGARVVPVHFTDSDEDLRKRFNEINGLVFSGGSVELKPGTAFFEASLKLFKWTIESNKNGNYFPLWGTCQGFEQLAIFGAGVNTSVLDLSGDFYAEDVAWPISFLKNPKKTSLFGKMPRTLIHKLKTQNITYNSHTKGLTPDIYFGNPKLSSFFDATAKGVDKKGKEFVAAFEAKNGWPIYGVQFHPEKVIFEWMNETNIPHTPSAISSAQYFADFLVRKSRCNFNKFEGGFVAEQNAIVESSAKVHEILKLGYISEFYLW